MAESIIKIADKEKQRGKKKFVGKTLVQMANVLRNKGVASDDDINHIEMMISNLQAMNGISDEEIVKIRQLLKDVKREPGRAQKALNMIIGRNQKFLKQVALIEKYAKNVTDMGSSDVLILGETGVGKELFAQAFYQLSPRNSKPLISVNCAGLSETLVESLLFGYEKGSFTGAVRRQIGLFEAAHLGTIFLDEVGELTLPIQAKLLRVISERTLQRLGSNERDPS